VGSSKNDFEYIETDESSAASFAGSLPSRFYEEIPEFRGGHVRKRIDSAQVRARTVSIRIIARFCKVVGKRQMWQRLRAENQRRHDLAASLGRFPMSYVS
jgi:hypothetical protein